MLLQNLIDLTLLNISSTKMQTPQSKVTYLVILTPIDEVPGYEPDGFVEIFSTIQFSTDCDVTVGAGRVTSYSKKCWWPSLPILVMTSHQWRHVTEILASKVNYPENTGVRLRRFCGNFFHRGFLLRFMHFGGILEIGFFENVWKKFPQFVNRGTPVLWKKFPQFANRG